VDLVISGSKSVMNLVDQIHQSPSQIVNIRLDYAQSAINQDRVTVYSILVAFNRCLSYWTEQSPTPTSALTSILKEKLSLPKSLSKT
jgi:hypothetical protein